MRQEHEELLFQKKRQIEREHREQLMKLREQYAQIAEKQKKEIKDRLQA